MGFENQKFKPDFPHGRHSARNESDTEKAARADRKSQDAMSAFHHMVKFLAYVAIQPRDSTVSQIFFLHSDGFAEGLIKQYLIGTSDCRRNLKCLVSEAIVENGYRKLTYGGGRQRCGGAAVWSQENVIEVRRKYVSLTRASDVTILPVDKDEEAC